MVGVNWLLLLARLGVGGCILADEMGLVSPQGRVAHPCCAVQQLTAADTLDLHHAGQDCSGDLLPGCAVPCIRPKFCHAATQQRLLHWRLPSFSPPKSSIHRQPSTLTSAGVLKAVEQDPGPHLVVAPASLLENWCAHYQTCGWKGLHNPSPKHAKLDLSIVHEMLHVLATCPSNTVQAAGTGTLGASPECIFIPWQHSNGRPRRLESLGVSMFRMFLVTA